jgi:hypothetical protein
MAQPSVQLPGCYCTAGVSRLAFKHIGHLAPGVAGPVEAFAHGTPDVEPGNAILVVQIDALEAIAPQGDVVEAAGEFEAQQTGHGAERTSEMLECKT